MASFDATSWLTCHNLLLSYSMRDKNHQHKQDMITLMSSFRLVKPEQKFQDACVSISGSLYNVVVKEQSFFFFFRLYIHVAW